MIKPKKEWIYNSYVKNYESLYKESLKDPEGFWEKVASELFWFKSWDKVLSWKYPYARWFVNGKTNIVSNAIDRHLKTPIKDKIALVWEGENETVRKFTYQQLNDEVSKLANGLKSLGLKKGDRVTIYLPRIPEQIISMLACAKIGLVHSVVFSGFSTDALKNRIEDAKSKVVICTNSYSYKGKIIESKKNVDDAVKDLTNIEKVIVLENIKEKDGLKLNDRDINFQNLVKSQSTDCITEEMDANDPLFILYTSGTTGKPKGIIHCHGGYMVGIYLTMKWIFNLNPNDIYFCTADPGWITGHSYITYSPFINGITNFVYESVPDFPDPGKWWSLIEKYKVTKFYTAPTAIRALMRLGEEWPKKYDLSSLKILGTVGEPINPEAWLWYYKNIGRENCPVLDTWWQTETGMHMIAPFSSVDLEPGSAFKPFFTVDADLINEKGEKVQIGKEGFLIIRKPWPSMFLDVFNDSKKYRENYWEKIPNVYFTGDSAKKDKNGYYWIIGRNDDVIKVSGHRLGSAELENACISHPSVAEVAVIGIPHEIKGESIKMFVILKKEMKPSDELKNELIQQVRKEIGPIASPDKIEFVDSLPKTRSGKIMRRVLKAQELGLPVGDTSTLEN
jgi:acetyl-CoA synthetase